MTDRIRDDGGRFAEKVTDQDILKAFDFEASDEDPYLTVREVTGALASHWDVHVTDEAVRNRLDAMVEAEQLVKRTFSRNAVAYRALVGPRLSEEVAAVVDAVGDYEDQDGTVSLDEMMGESEME